MKLGNLDNTNFKAVMEGKNKDEEDPDYNKINEAYDFFYEKLKDNFTDDVKTLRDKILDNLIYVAIVVDQDIDVYRLFETMNNRGLDLSEVDLIKNFVFSHGLEKEKLDPDEIKEKWAKIIVNLDGEINEERFFRQFLMSKKDYKITEKVSVTNLYDNVKKIVENGPSIKNFLDDVIKESKQYRKLFFGKVDCFDKNMNDLVNAGLKDIRINSETPFTLFLSMFRKPKKDPRLFIEVIELTNTLLLRGRIADRRTSVLDAIFQNLAHKAFEQPDPATFIKNYYKESTYYSDDTTFKNGFREGDFSNNDKTKYILDAIEEKHFGKGGKKIKNRFDVHIEHILPRQLFKKYSNWLEYANMTDEEHDEYKTRIGNLTLLERKPNIAASNNPFDEKRKHYTPHP